VPGALGSTVALGNFNDASRLFEACVFVRNFGQSGERAPREVT
jgi:hypothetical protein